MAASRLTDGRYGDGYVGGDHALAAILRYRSPFDDFVQGLAVPRRPRTRLRKCPGDAWLEAARRAAEEEATQEHEVAEALFDLANMFAAAEPVLEAEEAATNSPPPGRAAAGGGHRAKRARNAKARAPAEPVYPSRTSARNHAAQHSAHNTTSGFQDALARQADAAVHEYGLAAQLAASAHAAEAGWDRRSPANGLAQDLVHGLGAPGKLGNPAVLPNNGGFSANGLPSGLAGFYPPSGVLPPGMGAPGSAWGALPAPSDDRTVPKAQLPPPMAPAFSVPSHGEHRFPRCASHVYIAHFIEYQSKLEHQRQAAGLPSAGHYEGFYQPGAQAPPGFPGGNMPQQNGSASHDYKGTVKQEPQQQQSLGVNGRSGGPQLPQMSAGLQPFGGPGPVTSGAPGNGRAPPGAAGAVPSAAALQQQQQAYAAQLSQLAMLSQQSGAAFSLPSLPSAPPFLPPPGGPSPSGMPGLGGMGGLNAQQAAAAAAAAPFFSQQGFNLASLLPPGAMAQLAATSSGMPPELKDGLLNQSPSAPRLEDLQGLLPNASREEVQAWALKNLYANGNGNAAASQPQQQGQQLQQPLQQQSHQQGQGRQQNGQQHASQQPQQQGGNGGAKNSYQLAEAQLKQFHEAFANAERERKLRTAGIMDGHSLPPNIIDPAGGNNTRITLAHH